MTSLSQFRPPHLVAADAELAHALAAGDAGAVQEIVTRHAGAVAAVAAQLRAADADAVVVGTFVDVVAHADEIEPGDDFAPWIAQVTARTARPEAPELDERTERVWLVRTTLDGLVAADRDVIEARLRPDGGRRTVDVDAALERRAFDRLEQRLAHLSVDASGAGEPVVDGATASARLAASLGEQLVEVLAAASTWADPPAELVDEVLASVAPDRARGPADPPTAPSHDPSLPPRRSGRQLRAGLVGAGATIVLLAAGIVAFSAAGDPPARAAFEADLVPTGLVPDVDGAIEVTELGSGLRIELDAPTLLPRPGDALYQAWVELDDGTSVSAGTFRTGDDVTLVAGVALDRAVGLTLMLDRPAPASSPEQAASGEVVAKVDFPIDGAG